jgi:hypothetical protein
MLKSLLTMSGMSASAKIYYYVNLEIVVINRENQLEEWRSIHVTAKRFSLQVCPDMINCQFFVFREIFLTINKGFRYRLMAHFENTDFFAISAIIPPLVRAEKFPCHPAKIVKHVSRRDGRTSRDTLRPAMAGYHKMNEKLQKKPSLWSASHRTRESSMNNNFLAKALVIFSRREYRKCLIQMKI